MSPAPNGSRRHGGRESTWHNTAVVSSDGVCGKCEHFVFIKYNELRRMSVTIVAQVATGGGGSRSSPLRSAAFQKIIRLRLRSVHVSGPPQAGDHADSTAQAQSFKEGNYKHKGRGGTLDCDPFELPRPSTFIYQSVLSQNQHLECED